MAKGRSEKESPEEEQDATSGVSRQGEEGTLFSYADELAGDLGGEEQEIREEPESWVTFRLANSTYGLKVEAVREVLRVGVVTPVPHTPPHVRGVTNMRGRVLPVMDLRQRLGFDRAPITDTSRVLVVRQGSEPVGLLVDSVDQILQVLASAIRDPLADGESMVHRSVTGITAAESGLVVLLDPRELLEDLEPPP